MACALVLLLLTYVALGFGVVELFREFPGAWPYWIFVAIALGAAIAGHYSHADRTLLASVGADLVEPGTDRPLESTVHRLASLAGIPAPRLAVADTAAANAFAVGLSRRGAVVVVTTGLRERLTAKELEAVLAVAAPRMLGQVLVGDAGGTWLGLVWLVIWPLGLPVYAIGSLLTLTVSRYREFAADRGSAILTGAPEQLMSALRKLSSQAVEIPHEDLRAANAFCIVPTEASFLALFSDHPPLEKRLAALAEIAREMGEPVA